MMVFPTVLQILVGLALLVFSKSLVKAFLAWQEAVWHTTFGARPPLVRAVFVFVGAVIVADGLFRLAGALGYA